MNIKIIGKNSSNRTKLIKNVGKVIESDKRKFDLELLENDDDMKKYNISNTPALIIKDKIISQGKVLSDREIKHYIKLLS